MKEQEIRPKVLLKRYIELSAQDAVTCFNGVERDNIACVACASEDVSFQFDKSGFSYFKCNQCGTLYQNPRPPLEAFDRFYQYSESSKYWAEVFFPAVAEVRREKIFRPRVKRLVTLCKDYDISVKRIIDVGAGYGIFLDEWRKIFPHAEAIAIEPSATLAEECRSKGIEVVESIVEHVNGYDNYADLVVCFEVLEHVHDPLEFVKVLKKMVSNDGFLLVSTLGIDGFDLQVLGSKSAQVSPPHHINFISISGFEYLFKRAGFADVDVITPGKLDVDIVRNAVLENPGLLESNTFIQRILNSDSASKAFQKFLSENRMSSHTWVIGRKFKNK